MYSQAADCAIIRNKTQLLMTNSFHPYVTSATFSEAFWSLWAAVIADGSMNPVNFKNFLQVTNMETVNQS